jgi:RND family efflux transporter MFP subunit
MSKKKIALYATLAIVIFGVSAFLYVQSHPSAPTAAQPAANANVLRFKAAIEDLANTIEVRGKSSYVKEVEIYAPFSANVAEWNVADGAQVQKGDVLFRLDSRDLERQLTLQEANFRRMELEDKLKAAEEKVGQISPPGIAGNDAEALQRYAQQTAKDIQSELEQVNRKIAETELAANRQKLAQAAYASPDEGIFLFNGTAAPQRVSENEPIGKIVDISQLQMITFVGEYDVFRIRPGMPATVKIDALGQTRLNGKVEKVAKFPKPSDNSSASAQFEIVISLEPHPDLIAGLSLTAEIETDNKKGVLTVPTLAVQREGDSTYVMVETEQGMERREIKVGLETAEKTEVLDGLKEGETVVLQ